MQLTKTMELLVGLLVALGAAAFLLLALQVSDISSFGTEDGYQVEARFDNIGGLKIRAPVSMAGVRIGRVVNIDIDRQSFEAVVRIALNPDFPVPEDSSASILTAGLLGEQYISLEPGAAEQYLTDGAAIKLTQSALILERIIGQFLFNVAKDNE